MSDLSNADLIARARARYENAQKSLAAGSPYATPQMILVAGFVPKLLAALEAVAVPTEDEVEPEWEYDAGWRAPNGEIESNEEWSDDKDYALDILADLLNSHGSYEDGDNTADLPFLIRRTKAGAVEPVQVDPQPHETEKGEN